MSASTSAPPTHPAPSTPIHTPPYAPPHAYIPPPIYTPPYAPPHAYIPPPQNPPPQNGTPPQTPLTPVPHEVISLPALLTMSAFPLAASVITIALLYYTSPPSSLISSYFHDPNYLAVAITEGFSSFLMFVVFVFAISMAKLYKGAVYFAMGVGIAFVGGILLFAFAIFHLVQHYPKYYPTHSLNHPHGLSSTSWLFAGVGFGWIAALTLMFANNLIHTRATQQPKPLV